MAVHQEPTNDVRQEKTVLEFRRVSAALNELDDEKRQKAAHEHEHDANDEKRNFPTRAARSVPDITQRAVPQVPDNEKVADENDHERRAEVKEERVVYPPHDITDLHWIMFNEGQAQVYSLIGEVVNECDLIGVDPDRERHQKRTHPHEHADDTTVANCPVVHRPDRLTNRQVTIDSHDD